VKSRVSKRPPLLPVGEEMRRWSALLAAEVLRWPGTRVGKMFGLTSVYRGDVIFALLPGSRALWKSNAIAFKMNDVVGDAGKKWQTVDVDSDADLRVALERLDDAYRSSK
jgi:hypothetical protein